MAAVLSEAEITRVLSGATPEQKARVEWAIGERDRRDRVIRGETDLDWFLTYYFPHLFYDSAPAFHHELDRMVDEAVADRSMPGTIIAAPRGSAKTSRLAFGRVIHDVLYRRQRFIVIASKTQAQADERVQAIRYELETNERLRADFGDLCGANYRPKQTWQQNDLVLCWPKRDARGQIVKDRAGHPRVGHIARVFGVGTGVAVRGLNKPCRPTLIVADDLESDEHVATDVQRAKTWNWWTKVIIPMPDPKVGTLVVIGTILHYDSLLSRLLKQEDEKGVKVYRTKVYRAVEQDGTYLWPERLSPEFLENARRRMGTHAFNQEYLNNPLNSDTQIFRPQWWRWWTAADVRYDEEQDSWLFRDQPLRIFQACDPAISQEGDPDEFVVCTIGVAPDNTILLLDLFAGHLDFPAQIERLKALIADWMPEAVGIESNAYQDALRQHLRTQVLAPIRRVKHKGGQGKAWDVGRITAMSPYVENGQILLRAARQGENGVLDPMGLVAQRIHASAYPLFEQASQYPASAHDDRLDALEMAIKIARVRRWFEEDDDAA